MACIDRRPSCGAPTTDVVPEPLSTIGSVFTFIVTVIGTISTVLSIYGKLGVEGGALVVGAVTVGSAGFVGFLAGIVGAAVIITIVVLYAVDRCIPQEGLRECMAGVVREVVSSFTEFLDWAFPFTAMHDRVDVVVKSRYWDVVESGGAHVFCTEEIPPRRSEIIRSYYFDSQVCGAATGAVAGAILAGVGGVIAAALIAAAIGCATVILCVVAIVVALLVAAVAALIGALAGGLIGKAASEDDAPTADGATIAPGDLVSVRGPMLRREHDQGANVIWWVESSDLHGRISDGVPQPFSYCELDEELPLDSCS